MPVRASIRDIARVAGVSVGTASNIINGKPGHTEATRDKVLKAAADLNFTPNALIRSLQQGKTNTIGVLSWRLPRDAEHSIGLALLYGITEGLASVHYDALIYKAHPHEGLVEPGFFLDGRVDGAIMVVGGMDPKHYQVLSKAELPTVVLYDRNLPESFGFVGVDNIGAIHSAVAHLSSIGHRRIAYIGPSYTPDYHDRRAGYRSGLEACGIEYRPELDLSAAGDYRVHLSDTTDLITNLSPLPTAVITADDQLARFLIAELRERGLRVPEDISFVGFDDSPIAADLDLTTIRQPADIVGWRAAEFVAKLIDGADPSTCRETVKTELIIRGSTAPPRELL